jgi:UDP-glucose:glycoprotein glucosyltransferase
MGGRIAMKSMLLLLQIVAYIWISSVNARNLAVNLTATWPSARYHPLLETSEFLADEKPEYFWKFVNLLKETSIPSNATTDEITEIALDIAEKVTSSKTDASLRNILELSLYTRTYSVKVEMFRQLALDSIVKSCGKDVKTWAILYHEKKCAIQVACSAAELENILKEKKDEQSAIDSKTCLVTGVNDFELEMDHKFPSTNLLSNRTAIVYGLIGTSEFDSFHSKLVPVAEAGKITYILRHYPSDTSLKTFLQGYGVSLDIKNMEYKTIDDSKKSNGEEFEDTEEDEEVVENETDADEEDVEGLFFNVLTKRHEDLQNELKQFRNSLVAKEKDEEIKAWHLKNIGFSAAAEILSAKNPLEKLRTLSQDFPKHAKKLAFSRKEISSEFRQQVESLRDRVSKVDLLNKFFLNGIAVDPMQRSFNIFDFMKLLKNEWALTKRLQKLPLPANKLQKMLLSAREEKEEKEVRIRVRSSGEESTAPFYLNDITTDETTSVWSEDLTQLLRPAWSLIFIRRNMYEYIVIFDPTTTPGKGALSQISFLRRRGAPLQWGFLISSTELLQAHEDSEKLQSLIASYKKIKVEDSAKAWHYAKLFFLLRAKTFKNELPHASLGGFIDSIAEEKNKMTILKLVNCYVDATGGRFQGDQNEKEALKVLKNEDFDDQVLSMSKFILAKHLPMDSSLFNGVLREGLDLQSEIMPHFGRDQMLYQQLMRDTKLDANEDLIDQLLHEQDSYETYFSLFSKQKNSKQKMSNPAVLISKDHLEKLVYLHAPHSVRQPKKVSLVFAGDLNEVLAANNALQGLQAVREDNQKSLRISIVHIPTKTSKKITQGDLVAGLLQEIGHSDEEVNLKFITKALEYIKKNLPVEEMKKKLKNLAEKKAATLNLVKILDQQSTSPSDVAGLGDINILPPNAGILFINGKKVDLPVNAPITQEDLIALKRYDLRSHTRNVVKAFMKKKKELNSPEAAHAKSNSMVEACHLLDLYTRSNRVATQHFELSKEEKNVLVKLEGDSSLVVRAYVEPLSEATQRISSLLQMLHVRLNATVELLTLPKGDYGEFPLKRFYRYLFDAKPQASIEFNKLPIRPILTMKIDTPEAWNVQIRASQHDLDNLRVDPENAAGTVSAAFQLESLLVYGQCQESSEDHYVAPNGLQLVLTRELGDHKLYRDTLVMKNLGYFQLQATPGVWDLQLADGRATELYQILEDVSELPLETQRIEVIVSDFGSHITQLLVGKRAGKEFEDLLRPENSSKKIKKSSKTSPTPANQGRQGQNQVKGTWETYVQPYWEQLEPIFEQLKPYWNKVKSQWDQLWQSSEADSKKMETSPAVAVDNTSFSNVVKPRSGETIHVFSLASGHLYERFLKIMMLSVLKRTENPVTFWLLENFLSPDFKNSIPALKQAFGLDIRLVTYKWPNWLRQQTEKQRIIWGYKILFLDVLFPLGVDKIIYVDADQVVRADLKELWEMDLEGKPYGYTPFCDSRNVGFQFWRQGYWKDHLRGRPYHISALYVVDLKLFRQLAAGDMLRAIYDQLSADPNSLSNLDQDLPNYAQHQIPIFSLPQEWLWCESWCSDESKAKAKTIDLCNNPKHKEPKLDMAKRVISGELFEESWLELDGEIREAQKKYSSPSK